MMFKGRLNEKVFIIYPMILQDMAQLLVRVDNDLASEVRRLVKEKYGGRRGALSLVVEEALKQAISPPAEISTSTLLEVIDYVARASKQGQSRDQILTNVFLILDREFEQSIIRGIEDLKKRRFRTVPKGVDPINFLRNISRKA
jgi:hypothetical protein